MKAAPSDPITFLIIDVARLLRRRFEGALSDSGLPVTPGEARALMYVSRTPGQRQAALADALNVEPMTLVAYLDRLEKAGLVERVADPADRRAKLVQPTPDAEPIVARITEIGRIVREDATSGLDAAGIEALRSLLLGMRARLCDNASVQGKP